MPESLIDTFGRVHMNLRISVTDRCNIAASTACPPRMCNSGQGRALTFEEIERIVKSRSLWACGKSVSPAASPS